MDLVSRYQDRSVFFDGMRLTTAQTQLYMAVMEKIRKGEDVSYPRIGERGSGKTVALLKIAKDANIPYVTPYSAHAGHLRKMYRDIQVYSMDHGSSLRGIRSDYAIVDDCFGEVAKRFMDNNHMRWIVEE